MNNVTTTKDFKGQYSIEVTTPKGATYTFTLRNERGMEYACTTDFWNLTTMEDLDMDCLAWWPSKKVCIFNIMREIDFDYAASKYNREC